MGHQKQRIAYSTEQDNKNKYIIYASEKSDSQPASLKVGATKVGGAEERSGVKASP